MSGVYYVGVPDPEVEGGQVGEVWRHDGKRQTKLPPRLDLRNSSPTGFAWGYLGSGPVQLSIALLADALGDDAKAMQHYHMLKVWIVARLSGRWEITADRIQEFVRNVEAKHGEDVGLVQGP